MKRTYYILLLLTMLLSACELKLSPNQDDAEPRIELKRYDRIESQYLTTGDFAALQQMETEYPLETRTLIENVLRLGTMNDPEINKKLLSFFQDSTLQVLISDVESKFANVDLVNKELERSFTWLKASMPEIEIPLVYAQITSLDQSIIVGDHSVGVSLDKYMGKDYELYHRPEYGFTDHQLSSMDSTYIVPDVICFYLMSLYPLEKIENRSQMELDLHMAKLMWVTNKALGKRFFDSDYVTAVDKYMQANKQLTLSILLEMENYKDLKNYIPLKNR